VNSFWLHQSKWCSGFWLHHSKRLDCLSDLKALSISLSICLSVCLSACLSVCLSFCLSVCLFVCLPVCLPISLRVRAHDHAHLCMLSNTLEIVWTGDQDGPCQVPRIERQTWHTRAPQVATQCNVALHHHYIAAIEVPLHDQPFHMRTDWG
jgi:hypothetical protein